MATLDSFLTQIPDEFAKLEATIARVFETGRDSQLTQARVQGWIDEMNADAGVGDREGLTGSELEDQIRDDIARVIITKQVIMDFYGVSADEAEQVILGGNEGGINFSDLGAITGGGISSGGLRGVRDGGDLVKVERADGTSYFALRYNVQGIEHLYSFDSSAAAEKAIGGLEGATVLSEDTVNDGDTWLLGDAAAMVGQEGSYQVYFDGIMTEAALEAGIQNPGMLGLFAADQDIMRIMAEAEAGDWGDVRIEAAVRTTEFYLETLYPGIDNILKQGIGNPEAAWKNFNNSVEDMLTALGYTRDADGSFRSKIEEMLDFDNPDTDFRALAMMDWDACWRRATSPVRNGEPAYAGVWVPDPRVEWEVLKHGIEDFPRFVVDINWKHFADLLKDDQPAAVHREYVKRDIHYALAGLVVENDRINTRPPVVLRPSNVKAFGSHGDEVRLIKQAFDGWAELFGEE
ncbi:hypothetical protein LCGC14_1564330 [marine sediment metagenome]|uniref:Uncharacterized protein n=1 Tax=marine sediment metagenome TaxID=412755 RepID=A0A0F9LM40_9ZZZZ